MMFSLFKGRKFKLVWNIQEIKAEILKETEEKYSLKIAKLALQKEKLKLENHNLRIEVSKLNKGVKRKKQLEGKIHDC